MTYKYDTQDKREFWEDKLCCYSDIVRQKIDEYWKMLEEEDKLDLIHNAIEASKEKSSRRVDVDTLEHKDARDIGAEWLCLQALRQVGFDRFLRSLGWSEDMVKLAIAHLIVRAVYTPSELRSMRIMQRNSAVCWLVDLALCINTLGEKVDMLICSTPTEEAAEIYSMLNYKPIPFRRIKIRRTQQT